MRKRVVCKYHLTIGKVPVSMPMGSLFLHVGSDLDDIPSLWVECYDDEKSRERRTFHVLETGDEVPPIPAQYRGTIVVTVITPNAPRKVLHVYEEGIRVIEKFTLS